MSKFQVIVLAFFIICILAGVTLFATYKGNGGSATTALPAIEIWGTYPASVIQDLVQHINSTRADPLSINYVQKSEANFEQDFIAILARGKGPDAILVPQADVLRYSDKIVQIPNTVLTARDFKDTYIPQAELYLTPTGTYGIPFSVDPLVMYWNRDIFTNAGFATYPKFWDDFTVLTNKINLKDVNSNIRRSAIAFGEFNNVVHAREILSTLLLQAGNPISTQTTNGLTSTLGDGQFQGSITALPAVNFFVQFSNPQSQEYSWNRGLPSSDAWFLSGNLATYFGYASELTGIRAKNPNLDFDIAPLPQAKNGKNRVTYGNMFGFSVVRSAKNASATYSILSILTSASSLSLVAQQNYLPPVRRDMIQAGSTDPYQTIFFDSALISHGWLDTNPNVSNRIFQTMVESIGSGTADAHTALNTADGQLNLSLHGQ